MGVGLGWYTYRLVLCTVGRFEFPLFLSTALSFLSLFILYSLSLSLPGKVSHPTHTHTHSLVATSLPLAIGGVVTRDYCFLGFHWLKPVT